MIEQIKIKYDQLPRDGSRKLWVFFDEFNTLRELGFFKEIIMDNLRLYNFNHQAPDDKYFNFNPKTDILCQDHL